MKKHIKKTLSVIALVILCFTITILPTFAYHSPTDVNPTGGYLGASARITIDDFTDSEMIVDHTPSDLWTVNIDNTFSSVYEVDMVQNAYATIVEFTTNNYSTTDDYNTIIDIPNLYMQNDGVGYTDSVNMARRGIYFRGVGSVSVDGIIYVNGTRQEVSFSADFTPSVWANLYAYTARYISELYYTNEWQGYFYVGAYIENGGSVAFTLTEERSEYVHDVYYDQNSPIVNTYIDNVPIGEFLWESINGFLSTEIIGSVTFYHLISAVIVIPLLTWILKLLAGG